MVPFGMLGCIATTFIILSEDGINSSEKHLAKIKNIETVLMEQCTDEYAANKFAE